MADQRNKTSFAEHITAMAMAMGLMLLGLLFLMMAYTTGSPDGFGEAEPGAGFFGYKRDFVVLTILGLVSLAGGWRFWIRIRKARKG